MRTPTPDLRTYRNLDAYNEAFRLQQTIFEISKRWPRDETYALTGQIRRSSRAIGANIAEGWAKRRYPAHFVSKLTDADGELQESHHWLITAIECGYLDPEEFQHLSATLSQIGAMLGAMIQKHETFCLH